MRQDNMDLRYEQWREENKVEDIDLTYRSAFEYAWDLRAQEIAELMVSNLELRFKVAVLSKRLDEVSLPRRMIISFFRNIKILIERYKRKYDLEDE